MAEAESGVSNPLPGGERATQRASAERGEGGRRFRDKPGQIDRGRELRRERTEAEEKLWERLRARRFFNTKWRTQTPIGRYHPDFCCPAAKLIVELDGGQHAETRRATYDAERTAFLEASGYRVLRFWNADILSNMEGVLSAILGALSGHHPLPAQATPESPSPLKGEGR
jgi:very-short-patch-repair endonuclease